MLTYLAIGVSVQLAWIAFTIIRKLPSVFQLKGLTVWCYAIIRMAVNIILWPIALVGNIMVCYDADSIKEDL